jgi:hypothetical protein
MRYLGVGMLFLSLCGSAFAQRQGQYWSLGGFGNVMYPGTGHAPQTGPGSPLVNGFGRGVLANPSFANHPQHRRTAIVPYPVYYGGLGYGYDPSQGYAPGYGDQAPPMVNANGAPSVVINQNFVPPQAYPQVRDYAPSDTTQDQQQSSMRLYQTPPSRPYADAPQNAAAPVRRTVNDEQPTLYLIAFKDHSIVQSLGYWMEGSTLHYVSAEHSLNQVSSDLIDRDLSQRLNDERGVEFRLPQPR